MVNHSRALLIILLFMLGTSTARALDCGRASTVVENTVCDSKELMWLDRQLTDSFRDVVVGNPQRADGIVNEWTRARDACTSYTCLRRAYLNGIGQLYGVPDTFDWQGVWWNTTATHGNGGKILVHSAVDWGFQMDATVWGGVYSSILSGRVNEFYGVGYTNEIVWGGHCAIIMVPRADGKLEVRSDSSGSCDMLLPGEMAIDGVYVKAASDPRPPATLLTLGIFPNKAIDDRFRELVGDDYQQYLDTATSFVYNQDEDSLGATVVTLWVKGMANRQSAMIMFTPEGKIWALRVEPGKNNKGIQLHYVTTEKEKTIMPKTLANWRSRFTDQ
ncbi:lysozyme inhibitor LprI family protein [Erwinia sp. SLM-02]|uniref:lysozyme inhibitor LprI family protein n=1 Tax=Erwinia sp. SLM-02 TaxID=3020057 RepID=UPI00308102A5